MESRASGGMADAQVSKTCESNLVWVRLPPCPPMIKNILIAIILFAVPFIVPDFKFSFDISNTLTIVSLLFAVLVGFFIAAATTDYLRLQTLISDANADLMGIFSLGKLINPPLATKIADAIDKYLIAILDFPFLAWVPNTKNEYEELTKIVKEINPTDEKGLALFPYLITAKGNLNRTNQEITLAAKKIISPKHWFILISLVTLMGTLLLSLRNGQWLFSLIIGVILFAIYQILTLLHQIDDNEFLADKLSYRNPQEVFQAIGKMQYYPERTIKNRWVKIPKESYRIGVYKNYPKSFEKEIKIVER